MVTRHLRAKSSGPAWFFVLESTVLSCPFFFTACISFRYFRLHGIEDDGKTTLFSLNISQGFDFRSDVECEQRGYASFSEPGGFEVRRTPVFKEEDYSPEALAKRWGNYFIGPNGFVEAYTQILKKGGPAFKRVLEELSQTRKPVVVFCTAVHSPLFSVSLFSWLYGYTVCFF